MEVPPGLAYTSEASVTFVKRFTNRRDWRTSREIPGTPQGLTAMEESVVAGVGINVTSPALLMRTTSKPPMPPTVRRATGRSLARCSQGTEEGFGRGLEERASENRSVTFITTPATTDSSTAAQPLGGPRDLHATGGTGEPPCEDPRTPQGLTAMEESVVAGGGGSTLRSAFSPYAHYLQTADAYLRALERRQAAGLSLDVPSVASVFVSRVA